MISVTIRMFVSRLSDPWNAIARINGSKRLQCVRSAIRLGVRARGAASDPRWPSQTLARTHHAHLIAGQEAGRQPRDGRRCRENRRNVLHILHDDDHLQSCYVSAILAGLCIRILYIKNAEKIPNQNRRTLACAPLFASLLVALLSLRTINHEKRRPPANRAECTQRVSALGATCGRPGIPSGRITIFLHKFSAKM